MVFHESLEAQQENREAEAEYKRQQDKYKNNPDLANEKNKKANELFTSKKSPDEINRYKKIINKADELSLLDEYKGENRDTLLEIAEELIEQELNKDNGENNEVQKEVVDESSDSVGTNEAKTENNGKESTENNTKKTEEEKTNAEYEELTYKRDITNPELSVLNRLSKSGKLSADTNENIENILDFGGEVDKDFFESIKDNKNNEGVKDKKIIQDTLKLIPENKEAIPVDNLYNFKQDFPEKSDIAINGIESKNIKKGKEPTSYEILAHEYIGENYIKIGDKPEDKDKNYSTAIKTASANILKNNITIDKSSETFKQAILNIHSENKDKQFEGLSSLIKIKEDTNTENGAIGSKLKIKTKPKPKLEEQLKNLKSEYKLKKENKTLTEKRKKEIIEEGNKIRELLNIEKPKTGDIIPAGDKKIEKVSSEKE